MATITAYLDKRTTNVKGQHPIKIVIRVNRTTAMQSTGYWLEPIKWDSTKQRARGKGVDAINNYLDALIYEMVNASKSIKTIKNAAKLKEAINKELNGESSNIYFDDVYKAFLKTKKERTKEIYLATFKKIEKFNHGRKIFCEDINNKWLVSFDNWLCTTSPSLNARSIHLRNIRAVFNYAIMEELTTTYPFRRFKIKYEPTKKRNLSVEAIRLLANAELDDWLIRYRDLFMLTFFLAGINIVDLCNLKSIEDGRINYIRAKTKKSYSIKVEPEALAIIQKYKGVHYLLDYLDKCRNYRHFANRVSIGLRRIKQQLNNNELFPNLTTYWARHSWATIAAELDIPNETIAAALGHSFGNRTTAIYINPNQKKIDEANRKVIDFVLYGKLNT